MLRGFHLGNLEIIWEFSQSWSSLCSQVHTVASRLAVVVIPPNRQLHSGQMTGWLAFFLAPCLQFCCSQCRSGRRTPVDLGKTQESMVASLKIMIKVYLLQCVRGPKAVGFTMPHRQPVPRMGKKLQEDLLVLTLHGISNYLVKQFVFSCYIHYIQGFL